MSTLELKTKLKEKIEELNEDELLEHLLGIIEIETAEKAFNLPKSHLTSIETGLTQIKAGKSLSNEEVMKRVEKWADK